MDVTCTMEDVLRVLDALDRAAVPAWLGGGWGVDALVDDETRRHSDSTSPCDPRTWTGSSGRCGRRGSTAAARSPSGPASFLLTRHVVRYLSGT